MQINKWFYFLLFLTLFRITLWLILRDRLLLNLWLTLGLILLISWLIARASLTGIYVERKSRVKNQQIGSVFIERFSIENKSGLPKLCLEIIDHSELSRVVNSRVIYGLKSKQVNLFSSTLILNKRGFFSLGPTEIRSGDPFGLFNITKVIPPQSRLPAGSPASSTLSELPIDQRG